MDSFGYHVNIDFDNVLFFAQTTWFLALHGAAIMYINSKKTIESWKSNGEWWGSRSNQAIMRKFKKSCRPMKVGYKNHFTYKRNSILNYLRVLYRGTFRALCTLKSSNVSATMK